MEIAGRCHCSYIKAGLLLVFCCFVLVPRAAADERDRIAEALEIEEGMRRHWVASRSRSFAIGFCVSTPGCRWSDRPQAARPRIQAER